MSDFDSLVSGLSDAELRALSAALFPSDPADDARALQALVAFVTAPAGARVDPDAARAALAGDMPDHMIPDQIVVLDSLPRLPNGKLDKRALATCPLPETAPATDFVAAAGRTEETLAGIWTDLLGVDPIGIHENFFELGGDSIVSIQLVSRARQAGIALDPRDIARCPTIAGLAALSENAKQPIAASTEAPTTAPALPIQHWFLNRDLPCPTHWNQARWYALDPRLTVTEVEAAMQRCAVCHPALRMMFVPTASGWQMQAPAGPGPLSFTTVAPTALAAEMASAHASLALDGPMLRALYCAEGPEGGPALLIIAHHLVIDAVSWQILADDLGQCLRREMSGSTEPLPPAPSPLHLSSTLAAYANSDAALGDVAPWRRPVAPDAGTIPADFATDRPVIEAAARTVEKRLGAEILSALQGDANRAFNTQPLDIMVTALVQTLADWTGRSEILIDLEGSGRNWRADGVDMTRMIGWLTSYFPVWFDLSKAPRSSDAVGAVKDCLRAFTRNDTAFGAVKYLRNPDSEADALRALPRAEVLFNYLGNTQPATGSEGLISPLAADAGPARAADNTCAHRLEFNIYRDAEGLRVALTWNSALHRPETADALAETFCTRLENLVNALCGTDRHGYTPSDFPDAEMDQGQLDSFLDSL